MMREGVGRRQASRVFAAAGSLNIVLTVGVAAVGLAVVSPGLAPAGIAIALWLAFGLVFGVTGPVRMAYINAYIRGRKKAPSYRWTPSLPTPGARAASRHWVALRPGVHPPEFSH